MTDLHVSDRRPPTETTSLLGERSPTDSSTKPPLPLITPVVSRIQAAGIASCIESDWCSRSLPSAAAEAAFRLVVLLQLRSTLTVRPGFASNVWEQWSKEKRLDEDLEVVDGQIVHVWSTFLEIDRSVQEIEEALWSEYQVDSESSFLLRVVDLLAQEDSPPSILSHRIVVLSLLRTWMYGRSDERSNSSTVRRLLGITFAPRVLHGVDLLSWMIYLSIFAHFLLSPPTRSYPASYPLKPAAREIYLMIFSVARLLQQWSFSTIPHIFVLLCFIACLPSVPYSDGLSYAVLFFTFSCHIIGFHLPLYPNPMFLFSFQWVLPLAVLVWHGLSRILYPVIAFFLPALLVSLFLLFRSLADLVRFLAGGSWFFDPAPMESRVNFLLLATFLLFMLLGSWFMLVLIYPSLSPPDGSVPVPWDRYSRSVGLEARRALVRISVAYSTPYQFPAPVNLLQLLVVRLPAVLVRLVWRKEQVAARMQVLNRVLWRVTIAPVACVIAGLWLWGLSR